jgi:hypothetical protein
MGLNLRVPPSALNNEEIMRLQNDPEKVEGNHRRPTFLWGIVTLKDVEW